MLKGEVYQNYKVITSRNLYEYCDIPEDEEEKFYMELWKEQLEIMEKEITTKNVILHFIEDSAFLNESYEYMPKEYIEEGIQCLAIKDGVNLVRFANENIGFVAYYNGHENGFEIIPTEMTEEEFEEKY